MSHERGWPLAIVCAALASALGCAHGAKEEPTGSMGRTVEQASLRALPPGAGHDLVVGNCLVCHGAAMIAQQHKDTTGWNKTVTQMIAWGAPLPKEQQSVLVAYLAEAFPARAEGAPARQAP